MSQEEKNREEYDRSTKAFELYKKIYGDKIKYDNEEGNYVFWYGKNEKIQIAGDIDVNFKSEKRNGKKEYYDNILEKVEPKDKNIDISNLKKRVELFSKQLYSPYNISIMPVNGGLNNTKQGLGNDRLDTFLFALRQYYEEGVTAYILNSGYGTVAYTNYRNRLKGYLESFNGIYDYCEKIYHIYDHDLVDRLCDFGKKAIETPEDLQEYMDLIDEFWGEKKKYYGNKETPKEISNCYNDMLDEFNKEQEEKV